MGNISGVVLRGAYDSNRSQGGQSSCSVAGPAIQKEGVVNGPFKNTCLAKFCEISRVSQSRFLHGCQRLRVSNFCKVASDYRSHSLAFLKGKKVSGSQRKTPVSPSR